MTLAQIKALLDRTQEAVQRISEVLADRDDDDDDGLAAATAEVRALGRRALQLMEQIRAIGEKARKRATAQEEVADTADALADELGDLGDQLQEFEG